MKGVVLHRHGDIDTLVYEECKDPIVSSHEALVKVKACSVNHLDIWVRKGISNVKIRFPHIPGSDMAGILLNDIDNIKKGERVLIYPGLSCLQCKYCIEGNEPLCKNFAIIGGLNDTDGGYAEYVKVPKYNIIKIPDWLSYEEAASLNIAYLTAWNMLEKGNAKGKNIFVYAAGSGIGSATIQFAKALNCKVITTVSNSEKAEKAKSLKPDLIIDRSKEDIISKALEFDIDIVIDHVGSLTWNTSIEVLKKGGALITCGATSGDITNMNIRQLYNKQLTIYGVYLGTKKQLLSMLRFMEEHKVKPIIDSVLPLRDAKIAHKIMEESKHFGKIVLRID